jgi:hypothetical protein
MFINKEHQVAPQSILCTICHRLSRRLTLLGCELPTPRNELHHIQRQLLTVSRARAISGEIKSCKLSSPSAGTPPLLLLLPLPADLANSGPRLPGKPDRKDALLLLLLLLEVLPVLGADDVLLLLLLLAAAALRGTSQGAAVGGGAMFRCACGVTTAMHTIPKEQQQ